METDPFTGTWTYRSFINNPDLDAEFNDLMFGAGTLILQAPVSANWLAHSAAPDGSSASTAPCPTATRSAAACKASAKSMTRPGSMTTPDISRPSGRMG